MEWEQKWKNNNNCFLKKVIFLMMMHSAVHRPNHWLYAIPDIWVLGMNEWVGKKVDNFLKSRIIKRQKEIIKKKRKTGEGRSFDIIANFSLTFFFSNSLYCCLYQWDQLNLKQGSWHWIVCNCTMSKKKLWQFFCVYCLTHILWFLFYFYNMIIAET